MSAQGYYNNGPAPQYPQQAYPPQGYQQGPPMGYQQGPPPMQYQQQPMYQQGPPPKQKKDRGCLASCLGKPPPSRQLIVVIRSGRR
ncbi:hypothetical protein N0V86_002102 [Didymella sp. IMI 355093]|nr:hypothetical protein N0V86_002102 [Didymella sp. IMI 355093]